MLLNNHFGNHGKSILDLFKEADEIIIAVAFLKYSGLKSILGNIKSSSESF